MNTLLGTSSQSLARLFLNDPEPRDHAATTSSEDHQDSIAQIRTFSVRKKMISTSRSKNGSTGVSMMMSSLSYRMDRARKRQLFLKTYNLESADKSQAANTVKKVLRKVKDVVVSFTKTGAVKRWRCQASICASSPSPAKLSKAHC